MSALLKGGAHVSVRTLRIATVTTLGITLIGVSLAGSAEAKPVSKSWSDVAGLAARPMARPSGYVVVQQTYDVAAHSANNGDSVCPAKTVPLGGGVLVASTSVLADINTSSPLTFAWDVFIQNRGSSDSTFTVFAICATKPANWRIVGGPLQTVPPHSQLVDVVASCPSGQVLGGGPDFEGELQPASTVNSSFPFGSSVWRVDANNGSAVSQDVESAAICGTINGYHVVHGAAVSNPAGQQTSGTVACGTGVPLGGGASASSTSTAVAMNSSFTTGNGWKVYMNNASKKATTFTPYVVCSG